jgi:hypothetical protein
MEATTMKLTYRGVTYESNPTVVETNTATVGGKYRGLDWRFRNLKKAPILQPILNLKYRGVSYNKAGSPATNPLQPQLSTQEKARYLMLNRHKHLRNRQEVMLTRVANEIGLAH